jgi:hypothetical protein
LAECCGFRSFPATCTAAKVVKPCWAGFFHLITERSGNYVTHVRDARRPRINL